MTQIIAFQFYCPKFYRINLRFYKGGLNMDRARNAGEGVWGASAPPALFQEGQGGKSALLTEQCISLVTFNSPKYAKESIIYISLNILESILRESKGCGCKIFPRKDPRSTQFSVRFPVIGLEVWIALAFPFDPLALPSLWCPWIGLIHNFGL